MSPANRVLKPPGSPPGVLVLTLHRLTTIFNFLSAFPIPSKLGSLQ